ncbi:MAG: HEPN domain-containing protein [Velocimicrobium sp.]
MEGSIKELSVYRFEKAKEDLLTSKILLDQQMFKASINRAYYAMFHAMRAVTVLHGFDSSKHSGIIANFNQKYVKEGIFNKEASKIIKGAYMLREKSDYEDFYIASRKETEEQLSNN